LPPLVDLHAIVTLGFAVCFGKEHSDCTALLEVMQQPVRTREKTTLINKRFFAIAPAANFTGEMWVKPLPQGVRYHKLSLIR
jgi:hypothetical protein